MSNELIISTIKIQHSQRYITDSSALEMERLDYGENTSIANCKNDLEALLEECQQADIMPDKHNVTMCDEPDCGGQLIDAGGCTFCPACGARKCE